MRSVPPSSFQIYPFRSHDEFLALDFHPSASAHDQILCRRFFGIRTQCLRRPTQPKRILHNCKILVYWYIYQIGILVYCKIWHNCKILHNCKIISTILDIFMHFEHVISSSSGQFVSVLLRYSHHCEKMQLLGERDSGAHRKLKS